MKKCHICGKSAESEAGGELVATAAWHDDYRLAFCPKHYKLASFAFGAFVMSLRKMTLAQLHPHVIVARLTGGSR